MIKRLIPYTLSSPNVRNNNSLLSSIFFCDSLFRFDKPACNNLSAKVVEKKPGFCFIPSIFMTGVFVFGVSGGDIISVSLFLSQLILTYGKIGDVDLNNPQELSVILFRNEQRMIMSLV
ncbi:MAG: hypothetical protein GY714_14195 [Desulfobacterales bacterium]|nr:hypothetical protein [Desulfobacterales bacterium]